MSRVFNGALTNSYAVSASPVFNPNVGNWTYSAWIYPTTWGGITGAVLGWIMSFDEGASQGMWVTQSATGGGGTLNAATIVTTKTLSSATSSDSALVLNKWKYVTYTFNVTTGVSRLFLNGVEVSYKSQVNNTGSYSTPGRFEVGCAQGLEGQGHVYGFTGNIDTVGVWEDILTPVQMMAAMAYGGTPQADSANLTGYWPLLGVVNPEPELLPANTFPLTVSNAAQGPNSPGQTPNLGNVIGLGTLFGTSLTRSVTNLSNSDIIQVVDEGGQVVWSLNSSGVAQTNPGTFTNGALNKYFGNTFALAFGPNPYNYDVFQVVTQGDSVVFRVDYQGNATGLV